MQKYFSLIAIVFTASTGFSQRSIDSMVQAEKNFAKYCAGSKHKRSLC